MNIDDIELDYKGIIKPGQGTTLLHMAAWQGKIPTVAELLNNNAKINAEDEGGHTPFDYAIKSEHYHTAQFLLERGAHATLCDINLLLRAAFRLKNFIKMQMLIERYQADPTVNDENDWTLLHWAVHRGELNLVNCLLNDPRTNLNALNSQKMSPLDIAMERSKVASESAKENSGWTPLFTETRKQHHSEIVEILIARGAKPSSEVATCSFKILV